MRAELEHRRDTQFLVCYLSLMLLLPTVYAVALVPPAYARLFVAALGLVLGVVAWTAYRSAHQLDDILRESLPRRRTPRAAAVPDDEA